MSKIYLASKSPRRSEIMEMLPWEYQVEAIDTDETMDQSKSLVENLHILAYTKALPIAEKYPDSVVIGADTIVSVKDEVLGKPKDIEDAKRMLRLISSNVHSVYTGVSIVCLSRGIDIRFAEKTEVYMTPMGEDEIEYYIKEGEPFGKAGAYAIQGKGGVYVERINGDFYNVMGLPLNRLYKELKQII